jgi:hypothetical protein
LSLHINLEISISHVHERLPAGSVLGCLRLITRAVRGVGSPSSGRSTRAPPPQSTACVWLPSSPRPHRSLVNCHFAIGLNLREPGSFGRSSDCTCAGDLRQRDVALSMKGLHDCRSRRRQQCASCSRIGHRVWPWPKAFQQNERFCKFMKLKLHTDQQRHAFICT